MAEPFKNLLSVAAVDRLGTAAGAAWPPFPVDTFRAAALTGLDPLELKDRVRHIARALRSALPADWRGALRVLLDVLPAEGAPEARADGGFWLWPVLQVVEEYGVDDPDASLAALREMTPHFSAEFAVRPYLDAHPERAWAALDTWVVDPDPHVRRLVSEGSRPRLPWGRRLAASVADPTRGLRLLDRLVDDPSPYVRRSVANHLGDVAKDHPEVAVAVARRWLAEGGAERKEVVARGLRTLLKAGAPAALATIGHDDVEVEVEGLRVDPARVPVGTPVEVRAEVRASAATTVRVDVVWAWPGARGGWSSRTFRGKSRALAPGEVWAFRQRIATRPVSTRPTRLGMHRVSLRVTGRDVGPVTFELVAAEA